MNNNLCVIKLPGKGNYSIVTPKRIAYALEATEKELNNLISEEKLKLNERKKKNGRLEK